MVRSECPLLDDIWEDDLIYACSKECCVWTIGNWLSYERPLLLHTFNHSHGFLHIRFYFFCFQTLYHDNPLELARLVSGCLGREEQLVRMAEAVSEVSWSIVTLMLYTSQSVYNVYHWWSWVPLQENKCRKVYFFKYYNVIITVLMMLTNQRISEWRT